MKLWILSSLSTVSLLLLSGCGATPTPSENAKIDSTLPTVVPTKHGVIVGMKSVAFEWHSILDQRVEGIYVYKKEPSSKETPSQLQYLTTLNTRFTTHFVDNDVKPDTKYTYEFKTFSTHAEGVNSKKVLVNTLPVLQSVSWIHSITGMPRTAKIIWRPHMNEKVKYYIIERKTLQEKEWQEIDTVQGRLSAEYIDSGLADNYVYMYRVRVVTFDNITSTPSEIVKVVTKALPMSVTNIKATTSLAKRIKINWSESTQKDFAQYYLYRSKKVESGYDLIAKLKSNSYEDRVEADGKDYFYRVSVLDKDGLESIHNKKSIHGKTLSKPNAPAIVNAKLSGKHIDITWSKTDPRSVSYVISRKHKKGWFDESVKEFKGITSTVFRDEEIEVDSTYTYVIYSVDENGIRSIASDDIVIVTPESTEIQSATPKKVPEKSSVNKRENVVHEVTKEKLVTSPDDLDLSGL